jgi:hypothetical protein
MSSKITPEQRARYDATRRAKYAADPEERARRCAAATAWRVANPDRKKAANRRWEQANPERSAANKRRWRENNSEALKAKERADYLANREQRISENRLKRTGFTAKDFASAIERQHGRCAICQTLLADLERKHVHADHCHRTKRRRGILCHSCNTSLGHFRDDPALLRAAIAYLENPPLASDGSD